MMKRQITPRLYIPFLIGFVLCACSPEGTASSETQPTVVVSVSTQQFFKTNTPEPILTSPSMLTPTVTATLGPSPTLAPTPVFGIGKVGNDFLFGNQPPGCVLPCWHGLVIGETGADDIQIVLDMAFGFNGSYNFLEHVTESSDPDLLVAWYRWDITSVSPVSTSPDKFGISVFIHEDSRLLEALSFYATSPQFSKFTSPQLILKELGKPSVMWVKMGRSEDIYKGMARLMIIYDKGIAILYDSIPIDYDNLDMGRFCLGSRPPEETWYSVGVYLTRPIPETMDALSPIQKDLFGNILTADTSPFRPFEVVFGTSLEKLTEMAQQPGDLCVSTKAPE